MTVVVTAAACQGDPLGVTPDLSVPYSSFTTGQTFLPVAWTSDAASGTATIDVTWGDGNSDTYTAPNTFGGSMLTGIDHTYAAPGSYAVSVTVTAPDGSASRDAGPATVPACSLTQVERTSDQQSVTLDVAYTLSGSVNVVLRYDGAGFFGGAFSTLPQLLVMNPAVHSARHLFQVLGYDTEGSHFKAQLSVLAVAPRLRQFPRDDFLGGAPRQGKTNGPTSVQGSARQGWTNTYR